LESETFEDNRYGVPVSGVEPGSIRVKAMVVLLSDSRPRHLVYRNPAGETGPISSHRLLGGGVEFGELARDAAVREIGEELGILLPSVDFIGVVENLFEFDRAAGHQVVFVYRAVVPDDLVPNEGAWYDDVGVPMRVEWRPLAGVDGIPLYPAGLPDLTAFTA
jgi:ADP-ribose pyrophosphatase YjhB (NUDIX family)